MFDLEGQFGFDKGNRKKDVKIPEKDTSPHVPSDQVLSTSKESLVLKPNNNDVFTDTVDNQPKQVDGPSPKDKSKVETEKVRIEDLVEKAFSILQRRNATLREFNRSAGKEELQLQQELGKVINACMKNGIDVQVIYKKAEEKYKQILEEALKNTSIRPDSISLHWPIDPEWQLAVRPKETVQISFPKQEESQPEQPLRPGEYQALETAAQIYTQFNKLFEGEFTILTNGQEEEPDYSVLMQKLATHCQQYGLSLEDIKRQTEASYKEKTAGMYQFSPKWPEV